MSFKILSIDGGGIRGIIPGQILVSLEKKLQDKLGDRNARIGEYFDMVAGTSTGAILASAYVCPNENSKPKYSAKEAVDIYIEEGDEIFDVGFWRSIGSMGGLTDEKYSAKELENILKETFGDTKLSNLLKPTCFVAYDIKNRSQEIFTQHNASDEKDFFVREMLRGSSAAPTYFESAKVYSLQPRRKKHVFVDGGMVANDPTLCAYSEALKFKGVNGISDMMILSIGTGRKLREYSYSEVKDWGPLGWAKPSIDIVLEGGPQMTEYHMDKIASTVDNHKFYRIKPDLGDAKSDLDNATPDNIRDLVAAGNDSAMKYNLMLDKVVNHLVNDGYIPNKT